ncbi:MAG: oxidoreductase [Nocardioidaceae bacterium]|nr:oxidoreductase [Nocardioidaceae bacterium]
MTSSETVPTRGTAGSPVVLRYAAFTDSGEGGNPAGVVLDASGLSDAEQLSIAADLGFSETAFVTPTEHPDTFALRYFSPLAEVAFCGHATIATAVALAERHGVRPLRFDTRAGEVPISTAEADAGILATLTSVPTSSRLAEPDELRAALATLHWSADDLDSAYPAHVANAGNDHLILTVHDRGRLRALDYDYDALAALMGERGWTTLHLVYPETPTVFHARDPFPPGGVVEDPATGAAAAAFGGYLRDLRLVRAPATITVFQGQDMGRPSRLVVDVAADDPRVRVTGTATQMPAR